MKEIKQIVQAYEMAASEGRKAALATVVHLEGSAYRGPGARMLITDDGKLTGAISGGCLEGDALRKALLAMIEGKPLLATYDTADEGSRALGVGLGCEGIVHVLIEPISAPEADDNPIALLRNAVANREPAVAVTFFTPQDKRNALQGTRLAVDGAGTFTRRPGPAIPDGQVAADILQALHARASATARYPPTGDRPGITAFIEYLVPPLRLVVAGAGNDVLPLARLAELLGWPLTLMDGRPNHANERRFPGCGIVLSDPAHALAQVAVDERTAVVLMSHNYAYDKAVLAHAIDSPARYIGILGPVKKRERMLHELEAEGGALAPAIRSRIHGPMGLDIGAETAEEIALSVVAEIKAVFAGRDGGPLRRLTGSIRSRATAAFPPLHTYGILLLAAGESKRMGTPKQRLPYNGSSLLRHAAGEALETGVGTTVVVLGAQAEAIRAELDGLAVQVTVNADYRAGMGASIGAGMRYIGHHHPELDHVLVMVCDQPHADASHLRALIASQRTTGATVTASQYHGRKGVPALFHRTHFPRLSALRGDTGAKYLIESLGDDATAVPFPLGGVDIDTADAYRQAIGPKITEQRETP